MQEYRDELLKQIESVSGLTDQKTVIDLKRRIGVIDRQDRENDYLLKKAKEKGII